MVDGWLNLHVASLAWKKSKDLPTEAARFSDAGLLKHEFIKALHVRFLQEGIEIPYPQYVVHFPTPLEPS